MAEQKQRPLSVKNIWMKYGLQIFVQSSLWIAGPVIAALLIGRWLDGKYDKAPWFFLSLTLVAFIISSFGIGITGIKFMKRIENEAKANKLDEQKKDNANGGT